MSAEENAIYNAILAEDDSIFTQYFDPSAVVDKNLTSEVREKLKALFSKYSNDDFDTFILNVYKAFQTVEVPTQVEEQQTQTDFEETIRSRIQRPPAKEWNVSDFVMKQVCLRKCVPLKFKLDVKDELEYVMKSFSNKAAVETMAREDLRTILYQVAFLSKEHGYRLLYTP